jgi:two-component system chemotaxis response regulator CheB
VAVGASWGGLAAVGRLLGGLPATFGAAVVVVQHRDPAGEAGMLAELLARRTALAVVEAEDGTELAPGRVVLAPSGYHLLVQDGHAELSVDEPVHHSRPSIDVLFESVAADRGDLAAGVVLTGANADGADGLRAIAARGGAALVQDPADAERPEMPRAALAAVPGATVLSLAELPGALVRLAGGP